MPGRQPSNWGVACLLGCGLDEGRLGEDMAEIILDEGMALEATSYRLVIELYFLTQTRRSEVSRTFDQNYSRVLLLSYSADLAPIVVL